MATGPHGMEAKRSNYLRAAKRKTRKADSTSQLESEGLGLNSSYVRMFQLKTREKNFSSSPFCSIRPISVMVDVYSVY